MSGHVERTWDDQAAGLRRSGDISAPWVEQAVPWVLSHHTRPIDLLIDAGCGAGFAARSFAGALPSARVLAVDANERILDAARELNVEAGLEHRVNAVLHDLDAELSSLGPADVIWASAVVHHLPDPVEGLRRIGETLAPHGIAAIAEGGLPMRVLPGGYGVGRPSFLSRVEATLSDYFVAEWDLTDGAVGGSRDWRLLLADAGLHSLASKTFLLDLPAPVDDAVRNHVHEHYTEVRALIGDRLELEDRAALDVLLDQCDERSFRRRPDLFLLSAFTVHLAARHP